MKDFSKTFTFPVDSGVGAGHCFSHAKQSINNERQSPRIRLSQGRPVHISRLSIGKRFAAMCGFALGPLDFSVKIDPALYSQIIRDERISHGAYRLWNLLRDMTGRNVCCWPSVGTLAATLHTNKNSIFGWLIELEAALYLRIERGHRHKSNRYFVGGTISYHGGTKKYRGGTKTCPIGGTKTGYELNPLIQSKNSGRAACVKAQPPALPESKKELRSVTPEAKAKFLAALGEIRRGG